KDVPLSAEQSDWLQHTNEESDKQELEAHYMYMEKIQEVLHVTDDNSGPTYDIEPLEHAPTDNEYNVFGKEKQHSEQPESINDTYMQKCPSSKEVELEKYITYKKCQREKEEIEHIYKETMDLLAQQKHQSREALKTQAYETFKFKEKNVALIHQGSLENIRYDLLRKEKEQL
nr:hypothetical protein [Tanacetum cinerariifolium]